RCQRAFELHLTLGLDASFLGIDPLLLRTPIDIAFGLEHFVPTAAEAENRPAHRFDGDIAGENEQVGPADVLAVLALDRPQQPPGLVEIAVVRPTVEWGKALLAAVGAAASVTRAISPGRVPRHANEQRTVMAIVGWPPGLAVGHERRQVTLQRLIVEGVEGFGIIEVIAHRVGRAAALLEDVERERLWPPVAVR